MPHEIGRDRLPLRQHGQKIGERREDRKSHAPAVAVLRPKQRHLPDDAGLRHVSRELTKHRLGDDKADVVRQAAVKPLSPVPGGIGMTKRRPHPDFAVANLDRADRYVVCPQIEGTATFEIKSGVVPMTGQDTVVDAPAIEREAHMRATIVERKDAPAVIDDQDRTVTAMTTSRPLP